MLHCPRCSSILTISICTDSCCSSTKPTDGRLENLSQKIESFTQMGVGLMPGGVHSHLYQNSPLHLDPREKINSFPQGFLQADTDIKSSIECAKKSKLSTQQSPEANSSSLYGPPISWLENPKPQTSNRLNKLKHEQQIENEQLRLVHENQVITQRLLILQKEVLQNELQQNIIQQQILQGVHTISPSGLPFIQPELALKPKPRIASLLPDLHLNKTDIITATREQLKQSGWYYGPLSWQESEALLINCSPGTFLLRDSQHPGCYFSLSFQRKKSEGPTSIRIHFLAGKFSLDADDLIKVWMPQFNSIGDLILYCMGHISIPSKPDPSPVILTHPLYHTPPSLSHSARLVINKRLATGKVKSKDLELPTKLAEFLDDYQLSI